MLDRQDVAQACFSPFFDDSTLEFDRSLIRSIFFFSYLEFWTKETVVNFERLSFFIGLDFLIEQNVQNSYFAAGMNWGFVPFLMIQTLPFSAVGKISA